MTNFALVSWWKDLPASLIEAKAALGASWNPPGVGYLQPVTDTPPVNNDTPSSSGILFYQDGFAIGSLVAYDIVQGPKAAYAGNVRKALAVPSFKFGKVVA